MNFEQRMRNFRRVFGLPVAAIVRRNARLQDKPDGLWRIGLAARGRTRWTDL